MAWTTPGTAVAGEVLTAAFLNTNVRDNTVALNTPEFISGAGTAVATGSLSADLTYDAASITLTAGSWLVTASVSMLTGFSDSVSCGIWNNTASAIVADSTGTPGIPGTSSNQPFSSRTVLVTITSSTVYRPRARRNGASVITIPAAAAGGVSGYIEAIRVAY